MNYKSTRDSKVCVSSAKAIAQGISEDGGLFVPYSIPSLSKEDVESIKVQSSGVSFEPLASEDPELAPIDGTDIFDNEFFRRGKLLR